MKIIHEIKEGILEAITYYEDERSFYRKKYTYVKGLGYSKHIEHFKKQILRTELIINLLIEQLVRVENKSLELSELKEMVGKPVYSNHNSCYRIIKSIDELNKSVFFTDNQNGWWETFEVNRFYKHKPNGGEK